MATTSTALPDLTGQIAQVPNSVEQGKTFSADFYVKNIGYTGATITKTLVTSAYIDDNPIPNTTEFYNATASAPLSLPGTVAAKTYSINTSNLTPGTHQLKFWVHQDPGIVETDTTNNTATVSFTVTAPVASTPAALPDLTMAYSADSLSVVKGNDFVFKLSTNNISSVNANALAITAQIELDGKLEKSFSNTFASILPNSTSFYSYSLPTTNLTVGTHTIKLTADVNNNVAESNETNNTTSFNFTVQAPATPTPVTPAVAPDISLSSSASVTEGNSGSTPMTFTVTRTGSLSAASSVDYAISSGAVSPNDFVGNVLPSGTVTFAPTETTKTITLNIAGDTVVEPDEAFTLLLSNPTNGKLGNFLGTGTIVNDDGTAAPTLPEISVFAYASVTEGNSGSTPMTFTVTRTGSLSAASSVDYSISGGAVSPNDFVGNVLPSGTVSFAPNETTKTITLNIAGDTVVEPDEAFTLLLSNPTNGKLGNYLSNGTIINDDKAAVTLPVISISTAASVNEGNSGTTPMTFTVTRTGNTTGSSSVTYGLAGGDVQANDFANNILPAGTVAFAPNETSKTITVNIAGDTVVEPNESFKLFLSNPTNATLGNDVGTGTIINDDVNTTPVVTTPAPVTAVSTIPYNPDGIAGQAYRIYNAAFSRLPDTSGLDYWTTTLTNGKSLVEIATGFMQSPEFTAMYGTNPSADTFVTTVYNNVLHRAPDAGGQSFWVGTINTGALSKAGVLAQISESAENKTAVLSTAKTVVSTPTTTSTTSQTTDSTPPTLTGISPSNGLSNVSGASNLVLTFNEPVKAGTGTIDIYNLTTVGASTVARAIPVTSSEVTFSGNQMIINPNTDISGGNKIEVRLNSGVVKDLAGNAYAGLSAGQFDFTTADNTPPKLTGLSPAPNLSNASVASNIVLAFNEPVKAGTGTIDIYNLTTVGASTVARAIPVTSNEVTFSGNQMIINPATDFSGGSKIQVVLKSGVVKDLAGNAYAGLPASQFVFTTASTTPTPTADTTSPILTGVSPALNASNITGAADIVLAFNEPVKAGTGTIDIYNLTTVGSSTVARSIPVTSSEVTFFGNQIIINPATDFSGGSKIEVVLKSGVVKDLAGNAYAGLPAGQFDFTTASTDTGTNTNITTQSGSYITTVTDTSASSTGGTTTTSTTTGGSVDTSTPSTGGTTSSDTGTSGGVSIQPGVSPTPSTGTTTAGSSGNTIGNNVPTPVYPQPDKAAELQDAYNNVFRLFENPKDTDLTELLSYVDKIAHDSKIDAFATLALSAATGFLFKMTSNTKIATLLSNHNSLLPDFGSGFNLSAKMRGGFKPFVEKLSTELTDTSLKAGVSVVSDVVKGMFVTFLTDNIKAILPDFMKDGIMGEEMSFFIDAFGAAVDSAWSAAESSSSPTVAEAKFEIDFTTQLLILSTRAVVKDFKGIGAISDQYNANILSEANGIVGIARMKHLVSVERAAGNTDKVNGYQKIIDNTLKTDPIAAGQGLDESIMVSIQNALANALVAEDSGDTTSVKANIDLARYNATSNDNWYSVSITTVGHDTYTNHTDNLIKALFPGF